MPVQLYEQIFSGSLDIHKKSERKKLKEIVAGFNLPENLGLIIRTAGLGQTKVELQKDMQMLLKIWEKIEDGKKNESTPAPFLIHQEPNLVVRTVRDHFNSDGWWARFIDGHADDAGNRNGNRGSLLYGE